MIAHIRGKLVYKSTEFLVIDVNGIGYRVHAPLSTFYGLPNVDESVFLRTSTILREDHLHLYGFLTEEEKFAFEYLIGISGIGPKLAKNILSGIAPKDLGEAILNKDLTRLKAIPGVGRRTAERIILELRDKSPRLTGSPIKEQREKRVLAPIEEDVLSALINLGYKRELAEKAIERICQIGYPSNSLEEFLKRSLKELAR